MSNWYDPDLELTHTLHAKGDLAGGMAACERLLSRPELPPEVELLVRRNQTWHMRPLARARPGPFNEPPYWRDGELRVPAYVDRHGVRHSSAFNPSIYESDDGQVLCIVRSSNYEITPFGTYAYEGPVISTVNHLLRLHPERLSVHEMRLIEDADTRIDDSGFPVRGHEDARLYHDGETWCYSATVRDRTGSRGMAQMIEIDLDWSQPEPEAENLTILSDGRRHEKNWMPWVECLDGMSWVYSLEPTIILNMDWAERPDSGFWANGPYLLRHARGGTQVVPHHTVRNYHNKNRYLCLVHEAVSFELPYRKVYLHRLVELDGSHQVTGCSAPFCFRGMGIEFAAGLVVRRDEAIISYGVEDAKAYLLRLPLGELTALLRPVEDGDRWLV